jgi:hypothetical protein
MTIQYTIPMAEYKRPNGFHETIHLPVACTDEAECDKLREKLAKLHELNITITGELMGGMCNVCLDDGNFDYKFEIYGPEDFPDKVKQLVLNFDEEDYKNAVELNNRIEEG